MRLMPPALKPLSGNGLEFDLVSKSFVAMVGEHSHMLKFVYSSKREVPSIEHRQNCLDVISHPLINMNI